jgi:hypothetical protein
MVYLKEAFFKSWVHKPSLSRKFKVLNVFVNEKKGALEPLSGIVTYK